MRTTLDLPDGLIEEAQLLAHLSSKRETMIAALKEFIKATRRDDLRKLAGKIDLDVQLLQSRKSKR